MMILSVEACSVRAVVRSTVRDFAGDGKAGAFYML